MAKGLTYSVLALAAALYSGGVVVVEAKPMATTLLALSEIKREELPPIGGTVTPNTDTVDPSAEIPAPEPIRPAVDPNMIGPMPEDPGPDIAPDQTDESVTPEGDPNDPARPHLAPTDPIPPVEYDLSKLPEAVRATHDKIVEAAKSGKPENLRALIGSGPDVTELSLGENADDPMKFLLSLSGDEGGQEILAILLEIMEAGYVHLDIGTPQELYVWPYFFAVPLDKLDEKQRVELFKIVTSGDVDDMKSFGSYIFYRAGISPDGKWRFFLAGE
jgi:hypothetical protein